MRAAQLLPRLIERGVLVDRSGSTGGLVEVYPAAALRAWGLPFEGYKNRQKQDPERRTRRLQMLASLQARAEWLHVADNVRTACQDSDDVFDALIASLTTRAAAIGLCEPIPPGSVDTARREGWIQLPQIDSLARLLAA